MPKNAVFIVLFCSEITQNSEICCLNIRWVANDCPQFAYFKSRFLASTFTEGFHAHIRSGQLQSMLWFWRVAFWIYWNVTCGDQVDSGINERPDSTQDGLNTQWVSEIGKSNSHFSVWGTLTNLPLTGVLPLDKHTLLPFSHQASF